MAATKLIENKFLHYKTEAAFKADLKYISDESIVFVVEGRFIYSHGNYYYCNIREDQVETLAATLSDLMKDVELSESTIAAALCELSNRIDIIDQKPITKKDVGLSEVDNTSDLDKPISTATQNALNEKANKSEVVTKTWVEEQGYLTEHQDISGKVDKTTTVNGHALDSNITITKGDIGLGNVDNTSDLNKPISTAVQTALDGKLSTSVTTMPNPNPIKIQVKEVDLIEYDGSAVKTINLTSSDNITITSSGSTITIGGGTYSEATNTRNGLMSSTDKVKLDNIESGAQVNSITGVKGNAEESYRTGNVNITSANIGLGNVDNTSDLSKPISTATQKALDGKVDKITGKGLSTEDFTGAYKTVLDNLPTNYAPLVDGLVPAANLPSYVDDVIEAISKNKFPTTGESGKIYVALDTNLTYRWGGTEYVEISKSLALGETASTAYAGDKGAANATAIATHTGNTNNPHGVTKSQVGLGNVDNTSDLNKPVSTATQTELNKKVDKVEGKGLSTEDYTTADKTKLAGIASGAQVNSITGVKGGAEESYRTGNVNITAANLGLGNVNDTSDADKPISTATQTALNNKVDKVTGKGLSSEDYTSAEKTKLSGIEAGAQINTITGIKGSSESSYRTGNISISPANIGLGNVNNTSDLNKPISTATQSALNGKVDKVSGKGLSSEDYTKAEKDKLAGIEAGAQVNTVTGVKGNAETNYRTGNINITPTNIGLGNVNNTSDLNKPVSTAQQTALDKKVDKVTGYGLSKNDFTDTLKNKLDGIAEGAQVNSITGVKGSSEKTYRTGNVSISASNIGLGNVNNTSDADKPISTATQTALNGKVSTTVKVNGHALNADVTVSKSDVGLGNVDNTSDANKPVSTAQQTALDKKVDKTTTVNGHALSGNVTVTKADVGLGNVDNTSDLNKPISTATQTALDNITEITAGSLTDLRKELEESNEILGAAINEVKASKLGRSDLNIDSIKEEINETGSAIIASAESSINAAVQKLNEELEKADINGMKQSIDTIADVASAALGELRNRLDEQEKINSYMFNLLYSKIKELETKIK